MLSENFASALREIRQQMQALVKENEMLHKRIDELGKQIDKSDERIFKQQSKRIRQAAASDDYESLATMASNAPSLVDAELIRLSTPVETIQPLNTAAVPNNALVANLIAAAREGRIAPLPQEKPLPNDRNIQRALLQLESNGAVMAREAQLQQQNQQRMEALAREEYKRRNNAIRSRSPEWAMEGDEIIDY